MAVYLDVFSLFLVTQLLTIDETFSMLLRPSLISLLFDPMMKFDWMIVPPINLRRAGVIFDAGLDRFAARGTAISTWVLSPVEATSRSSMPPLFL